MWEGFIDSMRDTTSTSETLINFSELDVKEDERQQISPLGKSGSFDTQVSASERKQSLN